MGKEKVEERIADSIKEITIKYSIKKKPIYTLAGCLSCYTKARLTEIAYEHGIHLKQSQKKAEMIGIIEETLIGNIAKDSLYMTDEERELLSRIATGEKVEEISLGKIMTLKRIGYVYLFYYENNFYPVCPKEVADRFMVAYQEDNIHIVKRNQAIYRHIKALEALYGVYEVDQLMRVWNKYNKVKMDKTEIYEYINVMGRRQGYYWWDSPYIVSDYFEKDEEYQDFLKETEGREYYIPTKEELSYYMENEFDEESIYHKRIQGYFEKKNELDENKLDDLMLSIETGSILDKPLQEIFDDINDTGCTFNDANDINHFVRLYVDLNNHTRKWTLRGYKPVELRSREVAQTLHTSSEQNTAQFSTNTQTRKKKIGRNEPCPCGSGKKYKFCCIE